MSIRIVTNPVVDIVYIPTSPYYFFLFGTLSFVGHTRVRPLKRLGHILCGPNLPKTPWKQQQQQQHCVVLSQCRCRHTRCATRVVQRWAGIFSVYNDEYSSLSTDGSWPRVRVLLDRTLDCRGS